MEFSSYFWGWIGSNLFTYQFLFATVTLIVAYYVGRSIYNLKFHPLSKYPSPKLAAVTDLWWAYASTLGKYPWIIGDVLKQYGDVVRIAPNELVFLIPQAAKVKKLAPTFSTRNFKAKEGVIQKHIDLFIKKMTDVGATEKGAKMRCWSDRLALDLSAAMTYGREMGQVRDNSFFLSATLKLNLFLTLSQITRKFRLLTPFMYFAIPPSVWFVLPKLINMNTEDVKERTERRGKMEHLDYLEQLVPADKPVPEDKKEIYHLENVAGQLLIASWQPLANQFYSLIFFLLKEPNAYAALAEEVRTGFADCDAINTETIANLKYLSACTQESLQLHQDTVDGLPRWSLGALVDGTYTPRGVTCQISYFIAARSPRFFADPLQFRPER
ncbi:cytochrome P450 [Hypoxylon sp. FL1150]|nr:cytochrome P450 [Hypoxylon sp. FL1150]